MTKVEESNPQTDKKDIYSLALITVNKIHKSMLKPQTPFSLIRETCNIISSSPLYESALIILFDDELKVSDFSIAPLSPEKEIALKKMIKENKTPECIKIFLKKKENFMKIYENREICKGCPLLEEDRYCNTFLIKIKYNKILYGILKINVKEKNIIKEKDIGERDLFTEVAESLGFFLDSYETEKEKLLIKERFSKLFETSPYCIYFSSFEGKFLDVNNACVKILEYENKEELLKIDIRKDLYANPKDREKFLREIISKGYTKDFKVKVKKKNGDTIYIESTSVIIRDKEGNILGFQGIIKNVTELLKAEEALKKSEEKFRKIFNSLLDIYYQTDMKGIIKILSPSVESITGYKPEELIGKNVSVVYENNKEREKFFKKLMEKGEVKEYELRLVKKNGEIAVASINSHIIRDERGKPVGVEGMIRDITNRVKREETLRILARAIENLDIALVITNKDKLIEYVNPAYEKITGYKYEEAIGKHPLILQEAELEKDEVEKIKTTVNKGENWKAIIKIKRKDGSSYYEEVTIFPIFNRIGELTHYAALKRDITEELKRKAELEKKTKSLEEAYQKLKETQTQLIQQEKLASIGTLAAGIAHELNNPIGFIASNLNTLKKYNKTMLEFMEKMESEIKNRREKCGEILEIIAKYKKEKHVDFMLEDVKDLVEESLEGVDRITTIVKNLRSFSRVDEMGELKEYDIREGIRSTLIIAKNNYKYFAEVKTEFDDVPLIKCYPNELNQVFLNIIVNAAQAIESEKREDKGLILIKVYEEKDYVCCSIYNDGPKIPEDIINRIFDPFFTTKEAGKGTGLGLNISYNIVVNKHKGELLVENGKEKGVKFIIKLPKNFNKGDNNGREY